MPSHPFRASARPSDPEPDPDEERFLQHVLLRETRRARLTVLAVLAALVPVVGAVYGLLVAPALAYVTPQRPLSEERRSEIEAILERASAREVAENTAFDAAIRSALVNRLEGRPERGACPPRWIASRSFVAVEADGLAPLRVVRPLRPLREPMALATPHFSVAWVRAESMGRSNATGAAELEQDSRLLEAIDHSLEWRAGFPD